MRESITLFLKCILLSGLLFKFTLIPIEIYIYAIAIIIAILSLNIKLKHNLGLLQKSLILVSSNFFTYLAVNYEKIYAQMIPFKASIVSTSILIILIILILALFFLVYLKIRQTKESDTEEPLFYKREKDLERILDYIQRFNIIGIEAVWGNGKTFLIQKLKKKLEASASKGDCIPEKSYVFVEIDILSCNLDELPSILVKELDKLLYDHKIVSECSSKLKDFFSKEKNLSALYDLIGGKKYSYSEMFKGFQKELLKINKTVLIIYEDIDRIADKEMIKKIFYISEKISCDQVKVIYQYNYIKMEELGFERIYLDKYIPYNVKLSYIGLQEIAGYITKKNKYQENILNIDDLNIFSPSILAIKGLLEKANFSMNYEGFFESKYNIRTIEHFLTEAYAALSKNKDLLENKEMVLVFFFVKHFMPDIYSQFNVFQSCKECFKIQYSDQSYTIPGIIEYLNDNSSSNYLREYNRNNLKKIFSEQENLEKYIAFTLFDFKEHSEEQDSADYQERIESIYTESERHLQDKVEYETQNRMIWHLLECGKSMYSDYFYVADKLVAVLDQDRVHWKKAYQQLHDELYKCDRQQIDNQTIYLMGISQWVENFKAFFIKKATSEEYVKLIELFWQEKPVTIFNLSFVQDICACLFGINTRHEYVFLLRKINSLQIQHNFNKEKSFLTFLERALGLIYNLEFIENNSWRIEGIIESGDASDQHIMELLADLSIEIKNNQSEFMRYRGTHNDFDSIVDDFQVLRDFIGKMLDVINLPTSEEWQSPITVRSSIHDCMADKMSIWINLPEEEFAKRVGELQTEFAPVYIKSIFQNRSKQQNNISFILEGENVASTEDGYSRNFDVIGEV